MFFGYEIEVVGEVFIITKNYSVSFKVTSSDPIFKRIILHLSLISKLLLFISYYM